MSNQIRHNMVSQAINEAQLANPGNDINETYERKVQHIQNNQAINENEKKEAIRQLSEYKDIKNFFELKEQTYPCDICGRSGFTIVNCEHCVRDALKTNFNSWTSDNDIIDDAIKEAQMKCPMPSIFPEWIEYQQFENVKYLTQGGCAKIWKATWKKGYIKSFDKEHRQFIRSKPGYVVLKQLANSNKATQEYLKEVTL